MDAGAEFDSHDVISIPDDTGPAEEQENTAQIGWSDLDISLDDPVTDDSSDEPESGHSAGDSDEYSDHWFLQAENGTCVPASVAQIVAEYTGEDIQSEDAFVELSQENGYFVDGEINNGMSIYAAADLLEQNGIPATVETGDMDDLSVALDEGRGVMLYVDSGEYWDPEQEAKDESAGRDQGGDHCVVISEIDYEKGVVYLSDPGHPDGDRMEVPLDEFEQAWGDANNTMIVCDEPSPNADTHDAPVESDDPLLDSDYDSDDLTDLKAAIDWLTERPRTLLPLVIGAN